MTTQQMIAEFLAKGGKVTRGKKRKFKPMSFPMSRGSAANIGRKSIELRNQGMSKA